MKTFKELEVGDKIYIYANKPFKIERIPVSACYYPDEFIPGIYTIKEIAKMGFCYNFKVNTIIGSPIKFETISINTTHPNTCINRILLTRTNNSYQLQKIFITTSEKEWLEKINENI